MDVDVLERPRKNGCSICRSPRQRGRLLSYGGPRPLSSWKRPLTHRGRIDFQVKILRHRVELGEIESVVRKACGLDGIPAVGWLATPSGYGGVEAFIEGESNDLDGLRSAVASQLPDWYGSQEVSVHGQIAP